MERALMSYLTFGAKNHVVTGKLGQNKGFAAGKLVNGNVVARFTDGNDEINVSRRSDASGGNTLRLNGKDGFDTLTLYGSQSDWKKTREGWKNASTGDIITAKNFESVRFSEGNPAPTPDGPGVI
jgi:hypothetical protein